MHPAHEGCQLQLAEGHMDGRLIGGTDNDHDDDTSTQYDGWGSSENGQKPLYGSLYGGVSNRNNNYEANSGASGGDDGSGGDRTKRGFRIGSFFSGMLKWTFIFSGEDEKLAKFVGEADTYSEEAYAKGDSLREFTERLCHDAELENELGTPIECFDNYSDTFLNDQHELKLKLAPLLPTAGGAPWRNGSSSSSSEAVDHGLARLRAVRNMRDDIPAAQRWAPSIVMCGTKGAAVASMLFVRDSRPNGLGWTPVACATIRLGPSVAGIAGVAAESKGEDKGGGVEVGDTLLVDVQGALPHGISYLSRFGK
eukprot:gene9017-19905_t